MRTAEEHLISVIGKIKYDLDGPVTKANLISAVNQARKEAIEECSEKARVSCRVFYKTEKTELYDHSVDKQSILKLIEEIK